MEHWSQSVSLTGKTAFPKLSSTSSLYFMLLKREQPMRDHLLLVRFSSEQISNRRLMTDHRGMAHSATCTTTRVTELWGTPRGKKCPLGCLRMSARTMNSSVDQRILEPDWTEWDNDPEHSSWSTTKHNKQSRVQNLNLTLSHDLQRPEQKLKESEATFCLCNLNHNIFWSFKKFCLIKI